jgi:hypothetical protein
LQSTRGRGMWTLRKAESSRRVQSG